MYSLELLHLGAWKESTGRAFLLEYQKIINKKKISETP